MSGIAESVWFKRFIAACVVLNTAILALDHFRAPSSIRQLLLVSELLFTFIYFIEMVLKIISAGFRSYLSRPWNAFDFGVVVLSVVGVITAYAVPTSGFGYLGIVRVLRLFNLVDVWYSLERVLRTVLELRSYVYLSLLVFFYTFVFALIGRQLFAGQFDSRTVKPRWHFDSMYWAFLTCWQVLNGDSWTSVMYDGMTIYPMSALFFIVLYFFGANVLVKLFTSVLVDKFSRIPDAPTEERDEIEETSKNIDSHRKVVFTGASVTVRTEKVRPPLSGDSLFLFDVDNPIRVRCLKLATSESISWAIFLVVLLNSVILAIDRPSATPRMRLLLQAIDGSCLFLYVMESLIHIIAFGLFFGDSAYLRPKKIWNWLDVIVVRY